ncbi:Ger(x)C family spore germination protein [Mesobacillus maritimus]|uniref:Ger(x)C family spore germination protein n=1 Tax=Mesobacillus maritimus TaxID=1643336 RepID=UPI00384E3B22
MKVLKRGFLIVLSIFLLSGCWNRIEINDIAIVTAVGLDLFEDNQLRLSLQVAVPSQLGPATGTTKGGKSTFIISEMGGTISEAYRQLQEKLSRKIFFSHSRVLIIGEDLAKNGVTHMLDFYARYQEPRMHSSIIVTKGRAVDILKQEPTLENVSAEVANEIIKRKVGLRISIRDFLDMLLTEGVEPVAPQFVLVPLEVKSDSQSKEKQAINGAGVFKGDKLVGWMDDSETRGILWLRNEMEEGVITVNIGEERGGGKISTNIIRTESDIVPELKDGKVTITINTRAEMNVLENASEVNLGDPENIDKLEKEIEKEIKDRMRMTLDKAQGELGSDIFGFGEALYKKYPKEWNNTYKEKWDDEFSEVEVIVKPKVFVRRVGLIRHS